MKNIYVYILIVIVLLIGVVVLGSNLRRVEVEEQAAPDQAETIDTTSPDEGNVVAPSPTEDAPAVRPKPAVINKPAVTNTKPASVPASAPRGALSSKMWTWVSATYSNGRMIKPVSSGSFTMTLSGGTFTATTDCNTLGGVYIMQGFLVTFSDIAGTKKFCEGSLESDFTRLLLDTSAYHFTSKGLLVLDLKNNAGTAVFK